MSTYSRVIKPAFVYECVNCGAALDFEEERDDTNCNFCGTKNYRERKRSHAIEKIKLAVQNADCHLSCGRFEEAQRHYRELVDRHSNFHYGWEGLLLCLTENHTKPVSDEDAELAVDYLANIKQTARPDVYERIRDEYLKAVEKSVGKLVWESEMKANSMFDRLNETKTNYMDTKEYIVREYKRKSDEATADISARIGKNYSEWSDVEAVFTKWFIGSAVVSVIAAILIGVFFIRDSFGLFFRNLAFMLVAAGIWFLILKIVSVVKLSPYRKRNDRLQAERRDIIKPVVEQKNELLDSFTKAINSIDEMLAFLALDDTAKEKLRQRLIYWRMRFEDGYSYLSETDVWTEIVNASDAISAITKYDNYKLEGKAICLHA